MAKSKRKTCASGKIRNTATGRCVLRHRKPGASAHNRSVLKNPVVSAALSTAKSYADGAVTTEEFLRALHTLRRTKFVSVLVVLLSAIAAGVLGWHTDTGKRIAVKVIEALDPTLETATELVRDLWTRIFRKISKKHLEEQAKAQGAAKFAKAFKSLWVHIVGAFVALGVGVGLGAGLGGGPAKYTYTMANHHNLMRHIDNLPKSGWGAKPYQPYVGPYDGTVLRPHLTALVPLPGTPPPSTGTSPAPSNDWKDVLGLQSGVTPTQDMIDRHFKKLALKTHPNKGGSTANFQKLANARKRGFQHIAHEVGSSTPPWSPRSPQSPRPL